MTLQNLIERLPPDQIPEQDLNGPPAPRLDLPLAKHFDQPLAQPFAQHLAEPLAQPMDKNSALHLALHVSDDELFASAASLRIKHFGRKIELCAIINARSGSCPMNCVFCSQSSHYPGAATTFDMLPAKKLLQQITALQDLPLRRIGIVTSGKTLPKQDLQELITALSCLPAHWQGRICASLGSLPPADLALLHEAGLSRFHHNLESCEDFYPAICTTQTWGSRLQTVRSATAANLEVCCGGLFGLGESWQQRVDFALRLREEGISNVPLNFLQPQPGTPLAGQAPLTAPEALRIIAVFRHILPTATLRVCGGRPLVLKDRQQDMFAAGANALMTGDYLTTKGQALWDDVKLIQSLDLELAT